eukprot:5903352-Prymnesium_polylepis.1
MLHASREGTRALPLLVEDSEHQQPPGAPARGELAPTREAFNGRGNGCAWMEVCMDGVSVP